MKSKLIKIKEAAQMLGVSIDTMRRWDKKREFIAIRSGSRGHRFYNIDDIELKLNSSKDQYGLAEKWVKSDDGFVLNPDFHCKTRDVFQARLEILRSTLDKTSLSDDLVSLFTAVVGEIGNNSFDHNLGNWSDIMGIFLYYDKKNKIIILADRGQGVLKTLQKVKPELGSHGEALNTAFTQIISARHPEVRGNGLKFVRSIVAKNPFSLMFQTGDAILYLTKNNKDFIIKQSKNTIKGCLVTIKIKGES